MSMTLRLPAPRSLVTLIPRFSLTTVLQTRSPSLEGTATQSFSGMSQSAQGSAVAAGIAANAFGALRQSAVGAGASVGLVSNAFGALAQSASGVARITGASTSIFGGLTQIATAKAVITGTAAGAVAAMWQSSTMVFYPDNTVVADFAGNFYRDSAGNFYSSPAALSAAGGMTVSRASAGTAVNISGNTQYSFAANAARVTDRGMLIEAAGQNDLTYSNNFADASWAGYWAKPTDLAKNAVGPDGVANSAWSFTLAGLVGSPSGLYGGFFKSNDSLQRTASVWLRADSSVVATFGLGDGFGSNITITTAWKRFTYTAANTATTRSFQLSVNRGTNSGLPTSTKVYIAYAQSELGAAASSYMHNETVVVSRAADVVTLPIGTAANVSVKYDGGVLSLDPASFPNPNQLSLDTVSSGALLGKYIQKIQVSSSANVASNAFGSLTQSANGVLKVTGTASSALSGIVQAASGQSSAGANAAQSFSSMAQGSQGRTVGGGIASHAFGALIQSAAGGALSPGVASNTFGAMGQASAGTVKFTGVAVNAFGAYTQSASGSGGVTGALASSFGAIAQAGSGTLVIAGSSAGALVGINQAAAGQTGAAGILDGGSWNDSGAWNDSGLWNDGPISGPAVSLFGTMTQTVSGYGTATATAAQTMPGVVQAATNGSAYDSDATTYFNAMTAQPDSTRKGLINDLIAGLKTDGVWSILDWFVLYASHDSQSSLLNAKNPTKFVTMFNSPGFTANKGWAGGASGYGDIGEVANASGNNYSQNSASKGAYCNVSVATGGVAHFGLSTDTTARIIATSGSETFSMNDSVGSDVLRAGSGTASTARLGHRYATRVASNDKRGFFNGSLVSTKTSASSAVSTGIPRSHYSNGTLSGDTVACIWLGGGMSDTQANALHTRLHTYLTAIGANY